EYFCAAEDGIRDRNVTGVQTCALPIYRHGGGASGIHLGVLRHRGQYRRGFLPCPGTRAAGGDRGAAGGSRGGRGGPVAPLAYRLGVLTTEVGDTRWGAGHR